MGMDLLIGELSRRMKSIGRVFDLDQLAGRGLDTSEIVDYYKQSRTGYRWFHCREGAMHMALNPSGRFSKVGYTGQAIEVEKRIPAGTSSILELAAGNAYNLAYLASRRPDIKFTGIDLTPEHMRAGRAKTAGLTNVELVPGDFHSLPFADGSFDLVYAIEGLCHAIDVRRALGEIRRVLRPGGSMFAIDGWRTAEFSKLPSLVQKAAAVTEQAMSVGRPWEFSAWTEQASLLALDVTEDVDLTEAILPNLHRLERAASRYFSHPRLARLSTRALSPGLLANAIAGYLMPLNIGLGAHTYRLVAAR